MTQPVMTDPHHSSSSHPASERGRSAAEIERWLVEHLAEELQIAPEAIKMDQPILAQGVDSMHAVAIVAKLEDWLGIRFQSDPLEEAPSIAALARSLAQDPANQSPKR
jgi:acyl carrier protein